MDMSDLSGTAIPEFDSEWLVRGPVWPDQCGHGPSTYIGSILVQETHQSERHPVDVYVFDSYELQEVCVRYGDRDDEYLSPGTVLDVLIKGSYANLSVTTRIAASLLLKRMHGVWTKREEKTDGEKS
jgi:hypothetical protein